MTFVLCLKQAFDTVSNNFTTAFNCCYKTCIIGSILKYILVLLSAYIFASVETKLFSPCVYLCCEAFSGHMVVDSDGIS